MRSRRFNYIKESANTRIPEEFIEAFGDDAERYYRCYVDFKRKCDLNFVTLKEITVSGFGEGYVAFDLVFRNPVKRDKGFSSDIYKELVREVKDITKSLWPRYGDIIYLDGCYDDPSLKDIPTISKDGTELYVYVNIYKGS